MSKASKAYFNENKDIIFGRLKKAYTDFQKDYCEHGEDKYVTLQLYESAFFDYLDHVGLNLERDAWAAFGTSGFLLLQVDPNINIVGGILKVVLGLTVKKWPRPCS